MSIKTKEQVTLSSEEKSIIVQGGWLEDMHMEHFNHLLKSNSSYKPVSTLQTYIPDTIPSMSENEKHIQILHSSDFDLDTCESSSLHLYKLHELLNVNGHWVCCYYDRKNIYIFYSSNKKKLHKRHEQVLRRLFPFYPFDKKPIIFPTVQQQPNCSDCGVFAIAFATSLLFNIKPEKVRYNISKMRSHLLDLFQFNKIEHFPQDLKYGVPQTVLPLAVIRAKEAEAFRLRTKRQSEKTQSQKLNQKICNSQQTKKELSSILISKNIEQFDKSQNESCVENIDSNNKYKNNVKVYEVNKDIENKFANNHLQNKNDFEVNKKKRREMTLSSEQKSIIAQGEWLNDLHMDHFNHLLEKYSAYRPVGTWRVQTIDRVQPIPTNKKHIQILPVTRLGLHWTCCYYDTKDIYIYDSFNSKMLSDCQKQFLDKLFPTYDFIKCPVKFPFVQEQPNTHDCGVFAIAFAVSLFFNTKPENVRYDVSLMRSHLIQMFESNKIEHFPLKLNQYQENNDFRQTKEKLNNDLIKTQSLKEKKVQSIINDIYVEKIDKGLESELYIENIYHEIDNDVCSDNKQEQINIQDTNAENENKYSKYNFELGHINKNKQYQQENNKHSNNQAHYGEKIESYRVKKRLRYQQDLDTNRAKKRRLYQQDLENNRAKKRCQYERNLENNRAKQLQRYKRDLQNNRVKQLQRYKRDLQNNRAKKIERYKRDLENNRIKKRCYYKKTLEKQHAQKRIRYFINSERERERQKELYFDRKWLYNKRYYQKRKSESTFAEKNYNIAKNVNKKYSKFRSTNFIKIRSSFDTLVKNILHVQKITDCSKGYIEERLKTEQIVRWCFIIRNNYIRNIYKTLSLLKNKSETCLTVAAEYSTVDDKLSALCGISRHTASSENYFTDSMYHNITSSEVNISEPLILNTRGQIVNALPLIEARAKKSWSCSILCKVKNPFLIDRYQKFLQAINKCTLKNVPELMQKIYECTVTIFDKKLGNAKKGHAHSCYIDLNLCKAMSIPMQLLSPHFPKVRNIRRLLYQLYSFYKKMLELDEALTSGEVDKLKQIITSVQEKADMYKHQQTDTILSDDDIISKYHNAFIALKKRSLDTPRYICVSCERLCYKKNVFKISKLQTRRKNPIWKDLMAYVEQQNINPQYICHYCDKKFRSGLLPAYCILNNLFANDVPEVISSLNQFEKMLIQRAKAFQTVVKMGTVFNKKIPERQKIQKVKGTTFHLPLPLQETFDKLCSKTDPINLNHELCILVRNIPTKSKIIWENLVDLKKIYEALKWLRINNFLYSGIVLPNTHNKLNLGNLNNAEFYIQETKNDTEVLFNEECKPLNNSDLQMQEITDHVEVTLHQREAMLTQKDESDSYYEQYTIYPLYEKKENKTATALYQMLKIQDSSLDNREKNLDLMCFPDLYPFGSNGQCDEKRPVKLQEHEFIKCRLTSRHPRFRLNQQYLFYLLNKANIRQLSRGIYHKMNITDPRSRYTAAEYLDAMSKDALESNLNTIFSSLRNTEQYWRQPRNDLDCMTRHYGPATWFITLSPSEWLWDDLGDYIREVNGWQNSSLSTSELVAKDPVSTSRFLDNKFRAMIDFICSKDCPIGEVTHYFWRREYQGRGIQHFHLLVWIKDAPIFGESSIEEVSKFILKYITCKKPDKNISPLLYRRVTTHQRHKHNDYCLRNKKVGRKVIRCCRFGFPRPVTETLRMRDVATSIAGRKQLKHQSRLYDLPRTADEVDINDYNSALLTAWEGNMDIQYIGEKSTLLTWYVTKYVNKPGKSELSDFDLESFKNNKSKSLASVLWNFGLRSLTNRECGALEAADTLLSIALYGTDRNTTIKWLNVNRIRQRKLKSRKEIETLDGESTDIFCPSVIDDYYPNRSQELESVSLYEFVQWYDITTIEPRSNNIEYYKINNSHYLKRRQRACLINHYKYNVETRPEEYFFSLLLMFKPWRNLEDLRDDCDTYAQAFEKEKLHLTEALQYHEKIQELQKAFENAKELVRQEDEKLQKNVSQDDPDNPIGVQNIEAGEAMQDFRDLGDKIDEKIDVSEMITKLNSDQKRVFDRVIDTVRLRNSILRLYVSGEGGTGKSFLIKTIKCWIKQNLNKDTALAAPTGIAAFNIDGLTVHRLLQLPVEHGQTSKYKPLSNHVLKVLRAELKDVVLFVIDEVSMISNLTLMYIHLRLSEIFDTNDVEEGWFGRKHILLFGDLLQLPPVREDPVFVQLSNDKIKTCVGSLITVNLWTTLFYYDELTINMRQQEDDTYRQLLSRIRIGSLTRSDCANLESRKISFKGNSVESRLKEICDFMDNLPSDTVCLLPTRDMCEVLNAAMLNRIVSKEILLIAEDTINCTPYVKKKVLKVLSNNDDDNSKTAGLSKEIVIKIGAKVMIRRNIDATLGLVNGTIAKVVSVVQDTSTGYVEKIKLLLPSGLEYLIERVSVKFEVVDNAFVIRKQFPLCVSYGITIHKCQGLSLQSAVMDVGNSIFNCGQVYVALSRVTSLKGLHLINFDPSSVTADRKAIDEYNRLRYKYKPEVETISVPKERHCKVKDIPWTLSKVIACVQENGQNQTLQINTTWILRGFQNTDNVSCYANAVIQCLLHLCAIRKQLSNCDKSNVLRMLMHRYEYGMRNLNTHDIRQYLGELFSMNVKRDALEFFTVLCTNYDGIRQSVEHQITSTTRCNSCNITKTISYNNLVISISINNLKKKSYNLNDLLHVTFSHWCRSDNGSCEHCSGNDILFKNKLTLTNDIIIIHLALFSLQEGKVVKAIRNFNISSIPTTKVLIAGQSYKVMNAIFHSGLCIEEGHYTNICREGSSNIWIEIDDARIKKSRWPRGAKDLYVLFLQKVDKK